MSCYKRNLENLDELRKSINFQRELLIFQQNHLKLLGDKIDSLNEKEESVEQLIGKSIEQSTEQSIEQSTEQSIEQSTEESSTYISNEVVMVGDFAEMLKSRGVPFGRNKMHSWLTNRGYTYRKNNRNYAKKEYIVSGLFEVKSYVVNKKTGSTVETTIYLTPKGVAYFMKKILREFNIKETNI